MLTNDVSITRALELAARVKLMIFDIDGVFTDGSVHYAENGELFKSFNILDGYGLKLLAQVDICSAIITSRQSSMVDKRATDLGIRYVYQGVTDKLSAFAQLLTDAQVRAEDCGYMGDDWPDLSVMNQVTFMVAPAQAHHEILMRSHYVTQACGGHGAVREVCDLLLKAQMRYDELLEKQMGPISPNDKSIRNTE